MKPRIETIAEKQLVGHALEMSLVSNKTQELFSGFMPLKKSIINSLSNDVYEVMVYPYNHFKEFNPANTFTKWATVEIFTFEDAPNDMSQLTLQSGLYAVFTYKGLPQDFGVFMQHVFMEWLPKSEFTLDDRPHFNVLGAAYKNNHPDSEEDVYIPIKPKA
ncbi:GyrI-like domain-containing protein [Flavobacteriaceae sp. LMIT009]